MPREGFVGNADTFMLFFRACQMFHVTDEKARVELLRKLVKRHRAKYVRDGDAVLRGVKKCLIIKRSSNSANG